MKLTKLFDVLQLIGVVFFTVAVAGYFAPLGIDPHHDGILIKPAIDMLRGKMLFRDTFSQYGALTSILQAGAMHFFGEYLLTIKYLTVAFYGGIALFLWLLWRKFLPSLLTTLSLFIWVGLFGFYDHLVLLPWSAVYSLFCEVAALYVFVLWIEYKKPWMMGVVGVLAAAAFWFRLPAGVYMFGAVILFWGVAKLKRIKIPSLYPLFIGFFAVHALFLYWLIKNNAVSAWWLQSIQFASNWEQAVATQYRFPFFQISQLLPLSERAISIWVLFPAVIVHQGYTLFTTKKVNTKEVQLLAVVSMCLFSWLQYYPVGDRVHALWAATPMIGYFVYFAWNNSYKNSKRYIVFILMLLFLVPDVFNRTRYAKKKINTQYVTFTGNTVLKGMKENKINYEYFTTIISAIKTYETKYPNTFVVSLTADALYPLFGKNNINCSRFTVDWRWNIFNKTIEKEYVEVTRKCIEKYKPLVLTDVTHYNPPRYSKLTPLPAQTCPQTTHTGYLLAPYLPQNK